MMENIKPVLTGTRKQGGFSMSRVKLTSIELQAMKKRGKSHFPSAGRQGSGETGKICKGDVSFKPCPGSGRSGSFFSRCMIFFCLTETLDTTRILLIVRGGERSPGEDAVNPCLIFPFFTRLFNCSNAFPFLLLSEFPVRCSCFAG